MGWTGHRLNEKWSLFTRGGLRGVFIADKDNTEEIQIPEELLLSLAVDHILSERMNYLESLDTHEFLETLIKV